MTDSGSMRLLRLERQGWLVEHWREKRKRKTESIGIEVVDLRMKPMELETR